MKETSGLGAIQSFFQRNHFTRYLGYGLLLIMGWLNAMMLQSGLINISQTEQCVLSACRRGKAMLKIMPPEAWWWLIIMVFISFVIINEVITVRKKLGSGILG